MMFFLFLNKILFLGLVKITMNYCLLLGLHFELSNSFGSKETNRTCWEQKIACCTKRDAATNDTREGPNGNGWKAWLNKSLHLIKIDDNCFIIFHSQRNIFIILKNNLYKRKHLKMQSLGQHWKEIASI